MRSIGRKTSMGALCVEIVSFYEFTFIPAISLTRFMGLRCVRRELPAVYLHNAPDHISICLAIHLAIGHGCIELHLNERADRQVGDK